VVNAARTVLAGLAIVTLVAGCGDDDDSGGSATTKPAAAATTKPAAAATTAAGGAATTAASGGGAAQMKVTVDIKDFKFDADTVHVAKGGSVTWTNSDNQNHTATAAGGFNTGTIKPGESKTVTFDTAGTFKYACSFHPFMTGTVVVG
jgi:plastocyanin